MNPRVQPSNGKDQRMELLAGSPPVLVNTTGCLTIADVAKELKVSTRTVHRLLADGLLHCFRVGRGRRSAVRIDVKDFESYKNKQKKDW